MLQSIDTLIAFVVIMTVASLFVTILVQMCSAALSLRGKNLANALALTFQTIDPTIEERAHQLAARILSDPLISDSTLTQKDKRKGPSTQSAKRKAPWDFFNVRGAIGLANAVRPEEVYAVLKRMKERKQAAERAEVEIAAAEEELATAKTHAQKEAAQNRLTSAKASSGPKASSDEKAVREAAASILDALVTPAARAAAINTELGKFVKIADAIADAPIKQQLLAAVQETSGTLIVEVETAAEKFNAWFSSAQDRAQQWFQVHTRALTIGASVIVAIVLQLDAVEIFHFLSTNAAGRNALVAGADRVIQKADGVLDPRGDLLQRIASAATKPGQAALDLAGVQHVGDLKQRMAARDGSSFNEADFDRLVAETTTAYYHDQSDKLGELTRGVSATGFEFIPVHYWRWPDSASACKSLTNVVPHLPGIALFAALLTLGAPYWYNILKNLSSLRPALAQLIGQEDTAKPPAKE